MGQPTIPERFNRVDQTLDRILGLLQDHGRQLDDLTAGQAEIRADLRDVRREVTGIHEAVTEHLGWHLGRGA